MRKILVLLSFWKNFLILILIESFLDSWILSIESWSWFLELESWNLILEINFLLNLEVFLTQSWTHSWMSSSLLSWSVLDFWAFCHHLCYHQNSLNQSWFIMKLASTLIWSSHTSLGDRGLRIIFRAWCWKEILLVKPSCTACHTAMVFLTIYESPPLEPYHTTFYHCIFQWWDTPQLTESLLPLHLH